MDNSDQFGLETSTRTSRVDLTVDAQDRLLIYVDLLRKWQPVQNLVGPDTMKDVWSRHITDSLQLVRVIDEWASLKTIDPMIGYDLGSGAGLPGAILALATADRSTGAVFQMTLIEANTRKVSFLRTVSRETGVDIEVLPSRIEDATNVLPAPQFITARALAPLAKLATYCDPWMQGGATAFFHKGGEYERELAEWSDAPSYDVVENTSVIDTASRVLRIRRRDDHRGAD